MTRRTTKIRICHVAMADLWAGAEVQLAILLRSLAKLPDLEVSAILFNAGWLSQEFEEAGVRTHLILEAESNALSILRELSAFFRRNKIDVLHTHKYKDNMLAALASIRHGVPYRVRTVHGALEPFAGFQALKMKVPRTRGQAGRKRAEEAFSADFMAENVASVYWALAYPEEQFSLTSPQSLS